MNVNPESPLPNPPDPTWAWRPYQPDVTRPWNLAWAGHLHRRAGFGASWSQLQQTLAEGPQRAVDRLLDPPQAAAEFNRTYDQYEASAASGADTQALRAWWLRRMIDTPYPLLETMTLFWQSHFAVSNDRVQDASVMRRYLQTLRHHALGNFDALLQDMASNPAVFLALDAAANRQARPSAFLARTWLEQFTLGSDPFSPEDVQAAARAFTGWFVLRGELRFLEREHDSAPKTFLGQTGPWTSQDMVKILLQQPATARTVIRKLYGWFISETDPPPDPLLDPLVESFAKDHQIRPVVETMLRSNWFFSAAAYRQKIKSPIAFALGIIRPLEGTVSTTQLGSDLAALGQDPCRPPTIHGWAGHRHWINRFTLLARCRLAHALLDGTQPYGDKLDPWDQSRQHGADTLPAATEHLVRLFLQNDAPDSAFQILQNPETPASGPAEGKLSPSVSARQVVSLLAALPEFQLA